MAREKRSMVGELRSLDLNLLVALRALLDERHVSRAAASAGLTQSGMSRALQRLRTMFGDRLLVKAQHGYLLTPRAAEIDAQLEKVLTDILGVMVPAKFDPLQAEGELRIASLDYELLVLIPAMISLLRERAPGIRVSATALDDTDFASLTRGDVHLVFSAFDKVPQQLYRRRLFEEEKVCCVSTRNRTGASMSLEEFGRYDHVWIQLAGADPGRIDETLAAHGLCRRITASAPSFLLAARIVAETDLIAILPRRVAEYFVQGGLLKIAELPFAFPMFPIYLYWHDRYHNDPKQKWLRQVVCEVAGSLSDRARLPA